MSNYKLAVSLTGHTQDVRAVTALESGDNSQVLCCTASRDRSVRVWSPFSSQILQSEMIEHSHFVGALTTIRNPSTGLPTIASGGNDKIIIVWDLQTCTPMFTLVGHEDAIISLSTTADGLLISGSMDKTARVWNGTECVAVLKGHEHGVWSVLGLPTGEIVTASADHKIRLWKRNSSNNNTISFECVNTIKKHTDAVRSLCHVPNLQAFLSAGNDGSIYLWNFQGECLLEMKQCHDSFIYTVSVNEKTGEWMSGSEDLTIKIWEGNKLVQSIVHPGSVWSCCALSNGDILTGCSDGVARVWTRSADRAASSSAQKVYEASVSAQSIALGDKKVDKLEGPEALKTPGKADDIKVIKNGNNIEAYQWSPEDGQWVKVSAVANNNAKPNLDGKEFDHVFDIDTGDGMIRKIGFNNGDNPYMIAQEFIWKEQINQEWLNQIADFLTQNTKAVTIGPAANTSGDPFTGGNRYIPGEQNNQTQQQATNTSANTGTSHFPQKAPLFGSGNVSQIESKILESNVKIQQESSSVAMNSDEEVAALKQTTASLVGTKEETQWFSSANIFLVVQKLLKWPEQYRFPVLDLLRLMVIHQDAAQKLNQVQNILGIVLEAGGFTSNSNSVPNQMLALRFVSNMFAFDFFEQTLLSNRDFIIQVVAKVIKSDNKNLRLAAICVLENYAFMTLKQKGQDKRSIINILDNIAPTEKDEEIIYRIIVTFGTLIWNDSGCIKMPQDMKLLVKIREFGEASSASRVKEAERELANYLK